MSTSAPSAAHVYFGPYKVTDQVFYNTPLVYALVNLKPILPGHVLIIPHRKVQRLVELSPEEVTAVFTTVQKVQKMLAKVYFGSTNPEDGSFNLAIQDGPHSGQTVPHVHCHIIPRPKGSTEGDQIYDRLQGEEGNVGGGLWDQSRPKNIGKFPEVDEEARKPRSEEELKQETAFFKERMALSEGSSL